MSKSNDKANGTSSMPVLGKTAMRRRPQTMKPVDAGEASGTTAATADATASAGTAAHMASATPTPEQLAVEAERLQREADAAAKAAKKAAKKARKEAKAAAERAEAERKRKAAEAAAERAAAIAEAKASGQYRLAWLPEYLDGTLGRPCASPNIAIQLSPVGSAAKRVCWGAPDGPIGAPLTPEELETIGY